MSNIWSIIQKGRETLKKPSKRTRDISVLQLRRLLISQDDDIITIGKTLKSEREKQENDEIAVSNAEEELPDWLTKNDLYNIRKLKDQPIYELHEEFFLLDQWLQSRQMDKFMRETVYRETERVIIDTFPEAVVYPFGSFLTDL